MSYIQSTKMRNGMLIKYEGELFRVVDIHHLTQGNKRGHIQARLRNIKTNRTLDNKFRAEDDVERARLDEIEMQYLYRDGEDYYFMNTKSYEQIHMTREVLGDNALYLLPESLLTVEFYEDAPVGIHLPQTVDLKVIDAVPGIKGATAAAQVKPATMETGLVVTVPSFVNIGDTIRINTETGEYLSRV